MTEQYFRFGSNHCRWLYDNLPGSWDWIDEAEYDFRAWDLLDDVKRIYKDNPVNQIWALEKLRKLIGPEKFYRGEMPDFAPFHRFSEIK